VRSVGMGPGWLCRIAWGGVWVWWGGV